MNSANFYEDVYVKINIVERLEKQLSSPHWKREIVNLGGVTDNYQPGEAGYKLMPEILKLLIRYRTPAMISTKSDLPLRDYDLIDQLSRVAYVNIAASIVTADERIRRKMEPGSVSAERRFAMLKEFRRTGASTGLHCMPVVPFLTDSFENMNHLFERARECAVSYVLPGTLYLRGATRPVFMRFIRGEYPGLYERLEKMYKTGSAGKEYKNGLYRLLNELRARYSLWSGYSAAMKERLANASTRFVDEKSADRQLTFAFFSEDRPSPPKLR